jgi:hypothetical protein
MASLESRENICPFGTDPPHQIAKDLLHPYNHKIIQKSFFQWSDSFLQAFSGTCAGFEFETFRPGFAKALLCC